MQIGFLGNGFKSFKVSKGMRLEFCNASSRHKDDLKTRMRLRFESEVLEEELLKKYKNSTALGESLRIV